LKKLKAELILFFIAAIWGGTFVIIKVTLTQLPPFYFIAFRFTAATIIFFFLVYRKIPEWNKDAVKAGLALGILLFAGFASQTSGLQFTTASKSALITGVNLLIVPFAQYFIIKRKIGMENWIGVIVVFIGLYLLTNPAVNGINKGDLITLICAFSWAFYIIYLDILSKKYNLYILVLTQFVLVSILSFLFASLFENISDVHINSISLLGLLYTALPATLLATFLGNKYQKETSPVRAAIIFTFEQPSAVFFGIIFLKDIFTPFQIIGGVLMIGGILFSETFEYIKKGFTKNSNNGTAGELNS
jgi:drug/metabolite transporter (DMT)-like permease